MTFYSSALKNNSNSLIASFCFSRWLNKSLYAYYSLWIVDSLIAPIVSVQFLKCFRRCSMYLTCCHSFVLHLRSFILLIVKVRHSIHWESSVYSSYTWLSILYKEFHWVLTFSIILCEFVFCKSLNNSRCCDDAIMTIVSNQIYMRLLLEY
jgi:hypothetical protein